MAAELAIRTGLEDTSFPPGAGVQLLRVVQEALANAYKHSGAGCVQVSLTRQAGEISIAVADGCVVFDPGQRLAGAHYGLDFMAEIGGRVHVDSAPGKGTRVVAVVPENGKQ